ncbi:MAG: DUF1801 domain-containing protein [Phycisphaerae bacterium]|nr:DUF1801 domain-containing protein [Phycisphaerae bacterium]
MPPRRIQGEEVARLLEGWPDEVCDLALELREFVLQIAPELDETIAFNGLCYSKPGRPYGVIGGNVCLIGERNGTLHLGFIHGASLPDPDRLLRGTGKAKRHIEVRSTKDFRCRAFEKLIRAAIAHEPAG